MNSLVATKFERIGARAKLRPARAGINGRDQLSINILRDSAGEYFDIRQPRNMRLEAVDIQSKDRHLLLVARERGASGESVPSKYLCGHDEWHWFVAAVPEQAGIHDVESAKDALIPGPVRDLVERLKLPRNVRYTRHNRAFVRQGEWFFIAAPDAPVQDERVLRNEPIRRGAGKPHFCQELYRTDGVEVFVRWDFPNGLIQSQFDKLKPEVRGNVHTWARMRRDPMVWVRGYVRHPDHATIWLDDWHRVVMNTETRARAMRHVAFLD